MSSGAAVLAGDIGGTHTRLALFEPDRRDPREIEVYPSAGHASLSEIIAAFRAAHPEPVEAATIGVAGPVHGGRSQVVNLAWPVERTEVADSLGLAAESVALINDLAASAWGLPELGDQDLVALDDREPDPAGPVAVLSLGTGLGEAFITPSGEGPQVHASEGGHCDFAPSSQLEWELREWLARDGQHVSYEDVCSGKGLVDVYEFLRSRAEGSEPEWLRAERTAGDPGRAITTAAMDRRDPVAEAALDLVISGFAAQAGNMALTVLATGGVYLVGGVVARIHTRFGEARFRAAFADKGRLAAVVDRIPVRAVINERVGLLGAGRHARERASS